MNLGYEGQLVLLCKNQDWQRVLSLCGSTILRLEKSGDYPEVDTDKELIQRIIDIKFFKGRLIKEEVKEDESKDRT